MGLALKKKKPTPLTIAAQEKRDADRIFQANYRAKQTPQKRMWVSKKRRDQYKENMTEAARALQVVKTPKSTPDSGYTKVDTQRKAVKSLGQNAHTLQKNLQQWWEASSTQNRQGSDGPWLLKA